MLHISASVQYYRDTGRTDTRKGVESICGSGAYQRKQDAYRGEMEICINSRRKQVKLVLGEGEGIEMEHKGIDGGT